MYLNKKITVFTAGSAERKLACFMLDHISGNTFTPPTSMKRLSDMLGIGRASLYRAIDSLTECGAITEKTKDGMTVNIEKLKKI
jgi:DNA-binding IclR family transcriptional regulator